MSSPPVTAPSDNSSSPPPPSDSSSPPSDNSPPPPKSNNSSSPSPPSSDQSPPPPSSDDSPPPPKSDNSSPPPPSDKDSSPPPPQQSNNGSNSPPSNNNGSNSPPSNNNGSNSPPSNNNGNNSPPSKNNSSKSPPPPSSNNDDSPSPPPPPPPPPPPHSPKSSSPSSEALGPPPTRGSSQSDSERFFNDHKVAIGVSAGVLALIIIMIVIISCSKKKKRRNDPRHYYMDTAPGPKGAASGYYNSSQQQSWQNGPMDHVMKMPPSSGPSGPPGGGWLHPPPPPPPMMSSSEISSNFSGGQRHPVLPPPSPNLALGFNKSSFSYEELAHATNGFSQANLLGQGGFGYVHKGVLPNGKIIAVKSLKSGSGQGEREFQAEVEIISRVHHRHLVSLVGYCIAGGQRMLIYEFVPNNNLEYHLHGKGRPTMEWHKRITIALGSAKGLAYLHEDCHPRIIHRDIKAANILLDDNWEAMVADFGLAKLSADTNTHVSTRARPLLTRAQEDGNYEGLADPHLNNNFNPSEMARMVACASASVRHSARRRPKMSQIVRILEGDASLDALNESVQAGTSGSSDYDTASYNADMKKFRSLALNSQEYPSSEYGAHTGEFGRKSSSSSRSP
ncbi:hypothetical protein IFM89_011074 [Coptis chinensis]|uniref:non-specific serine/threonine protein kinase n=1 Tax=Coptis chinensis TaxID=261450 RepID=A0A835INA3_9MAGN|nr:hypothetical protein IFM89_011074 [Coptis chinensis]